jgi:integrase
VPKLKLEWRPDRSVWYIRGTLRGVKVRETCGTDDKEAAEAIRAKREWEILQGSVFGFKAAGTFIDGALIYLEAGGERRFMQPLIDHFGNTPLDKIDQAALDAAARKLYPTAAPATLNRQLFAIVSAVRNAAAARGICSPMRIERPKNPKGRVRWLTHDEAGRLLDACAPHLRPLVAFLFYTGARIGEALWLDWRAVDLKRAHVTFVDTKTDDARGVPLHPAAVAVLASLPHREGEVFRRPDGYPYEPLREDDDNDRSAGTRIKTAFRAACRRAGINDFSPHDCRHTWATWHYQQNRDLNALMRLGGWKSERMVLRYAHINLGEVAHTIKAMAAIASRTKSTKKRSTSERGRKHGI